MKDNSLFYLCSLIEYIGRLKLRKRKDVVNKLGYDNLKQLYYDSEILHCEPIAKIADEVVHYYHIYQGKFDNIKTCEYRIPDYWDIGDVYTRLITDVNNGDLIKTLIEVYNSKFSDDIQNFNSATYFQSRESNKYYYLESIKK